MASQLGDEDCRDVCLEGPRGVGVSHNKGKVWDVTQHYAIVHHMVGGIVLLSINRDIDGAEREVFLQVETCGRYDEVCVNMLSAPHLDSLLCDVFNVTCYHRGLSLPNETL